MHCSSDFFVFMDVKSMKNALVFIYYFVAKTFGLIYLLIITFPWGMNKGLFKHDIKSAPLPTDRFFS